MRKIELNQNKYYIEQLGKMASGLNKIFNLKSRLYQKRKEEGKLADNTFRQLAKEGLLTDEIISYYKEYKTAHGEVLRLKAQGITIGSEWEVAVANESHWLNLLTDEIKTNGQAWIDNGIVTGETAESIYELIGYTGDVYELMGDLSAEISTGTGVVDGFISSITNMWRVAAPPEGIDSGVEEYSKAIYDFLLPTFTDMGIMIDSESQMLKYLNKWMGKSYSSLSDMIDGQIIAARAFMATSDVIGYQLDDLSDTDATFDSMIDNTDYLTGNFDDFSYSAQTSYDELGNLNDVVSDLNQTIKDLGDVLEPILTTLNTLSQLQVAIAMGYEIDTLEIDENGNVLINGIKVLDIASKKVILKVGLEIEDVPPSLKQGRFLSGIYNTRNLGSLISLISGLKRENVAWTSDIDFSNPFAYVSSIKTDFPWEQYGV